MYSHLFQCEVQLANPKLTGQAKTSQKKVKDNSKLLKLIYFQKST